MPSSKSLPYYQDSHALSYQLHIPNQPRRYVRRALRTIMSLSRLRLNIVVFEMVATSPRPLWLRPKAYLRLSEAKCRRKVQPGIGSTLTRPCQVGGHKLRLFTWKATSQSHFGRCLTYPRRQQVLLNLVIIYNWIRYII